MARKTEKPHSTSSELVVGNRDSFATYQMMEAYFSYLQYLLRNTESELVRLSLTQWRVLTLIRYNRDRMQRELSEAVGIDPSSMTPIIDQFVDKGWVRRHPSKLNRSAHAIRVTAKGAKAYSSIERELEKLEDFIKSQFSGNEYRTLRDLLFKLQNILENA